jgi:uncharacterized damage-inducible protein DinB
MRRTALLLGALIVATPALAQKAATSASLFAYTSYINYVTKAAEQMPEDGYAFRATDKVRTFGQLIGHVAGAQRMFCAIALGEKPGGEDDIERTKTTKAELVAALKESTEYCKRAYNQTDASASLPADFFGQKTTRLGILNMNSGHNAEHYGNIVTYFRLKGMTPPSSQGQ